MAEISLDPQTIESVLLSLATYRHASAELLGEQLHVPPAVMASALRHLEAQGILTHQEQIVGNRVRAFYELSGQAAASLVKYSQTYAVPSDAAEELLDQITALLVKASDSLPSSVPTVQIGIMAFLRPIPLVKEEQE